MISHELMEEPSYKQLKCHTFGHVAEEDQVFALADRRYIVLLDRRCFWQFVRESSVYPKLVPAGIIFAYDLKGELTLPAIFSDTEFLGCFIKHVWSIIVVCKTVNTWHCPVNKNQVKLNVTTRSIVARETKKPCLPFD